MEGRFIGVPGGRPFSVEEDMELDLTAELDELAAKRTEEFLRRKQAKAEERAKRKRQRDWGLEQRHAAKLARNAA